MKCTILIALFLVSLTANAQSDTVAYWFSHQLFEQDSARLDGFMSAKKNAFRYYVSAKNTPSRKAKTFY